MDKNQQRIAIAKACGWRYVTTEKYFNKLYAPTSVPPVGACCGKHLTEEEAFVLSFNPHPETVNVVPDYLNDLNAMHEAEKVLLANPNLMNKYQNFELAKFVDGTKTNWLCRATAAQRAEAFLKVTGKWID